jgi:lipopolysaccharide/colanic/teichoic acid biosynthesis glycosyltransferase
MFDNENAAAMISGHNRDIPLRVPANRSAAKKLHIYLPVKLGLEWMLALVAMVALLPLLIFLAILVKATSKGPMFYKQDRLGYRGRIFKIYKLRTMVQHAEAVTGPVWAAKQDSRVTPLGRILRKSHLDELPQLLNVLKMDMGVVGPRPERPEIAARITRQLPDFPRRLEVRPGITGLAQVMIPADDPEDINFDGVRKKLEFDLLYLKKTQFFVDLRVYLCTACKMAMGLLELSRDWLTKPFGRPIVNNHAQTEEEPIQYEQAV